MPEENKPFFVAAQQAVINTPSSTPFSAEELRAALRNPLIAIDVLLAQRPRWTQTVIENKQLVAMTLVMLVWTLAFSLPYGFVLSPERTWQIAALFFGSVALCLPSLHVVSAYLGMRIHIAQSFAFATIVATVAAIFSFGFAPILWFIQITSNASTPHNTLGTLSGLLLCTAALAGIVHGMRCMKFARDLDGGFGLVLFIWQLLLIFIGARMASALGLS